MLRDLQSVRRGLGVYILRTADFRFVLRSRATTTKRRLKPDARVTYLAEVRGHRGS